MRRNPKIVSLIPPLEAAAGLSTNPALREDIQAAILDSPELMRELSADAQQIMSQEIGHGHYARAFRLPNGLVLKVTTDRDDAEAAFLVQQEGYVEGLVGVDSVWLMPNSVRSESEAYSVLSHQFEMVPLSFGEPAYAIVLEPVQPLDDHPDRYEAIAAAQTLRSVERTGLLDGAPVSDEEWLFGMIFADPSGSEPVDGYEEVRRYVRSILHGWLWLAERGYEVHDLHLGNFGIASPNRLVMFDFGHMSAIGESKHLDIPIAKNPSSSKVDRVFDHAFDTLEKKFPDMGTIELHEDEKAGTDNGAGADRQFAYCMDGDPIVIAFAPKAEALPESRLHGLMRHEMGHALEYRFGVSEMERRLGCRLPPEVERRADAIADAVWGSPVRYDERDVQCIGCRSGSRSRPRDLPDKRENLRANGATTRGRIVVDSDDSVDEMIVNWYPDEPNYEGLLNVGNGIGAFLVLEPYEDGLQVQYVEVDERFKRQGVATRLYQEAMSLARERGGTLVSDSRQEPEAKAFWDKMCDRGLAEKHREGKVYYYAMRADAPSILPNPRR